MKSGNGRWKTFALLVGCGAAFAQAAHSEEFYKGRTVNLYLGFAPGGSYDFYGRLLARYLGKHLPGNPVIVPQSMPGAGSLRAANFLFSAAPKDGTALGIVTQTLPLEEALLNPSAKYKTSQFTWIGRMTDVSDLALAWHTARAHSAKDLRQIETTMATTGPGSTTYGFPKLLNTLAGTKFKLVSGYPGSTDAMLAMERGETDSASTSYNTLRTAKAAWMRDKQVRILLSYTGSRIKTLPDVPAAPELALDETGRRILSFYASSADVGRSFVAPPGLPPERVKELRTAFDAAMTDPDLIAELEKVGADLQPMDGPSLERMVLGTTSTLSESDLNRMRKILDADK